MNARIRNFVAHPLFCFAALCLAFSATAQTNQPIYTDSLQNGWQNWSWATVNIADTSPVHSGTRSISVTCLSNNYQALYLHQTAFDSTPYTNITFWMYVTNSNVPVKVQGTLNGTAQSSYYQVPTLTTNTWTLITVPLSALGVANQPNMDGFWIQNENGSPIPTFFVDDITLNTNVAGPPGTNSTAVITIDAGANRHPISPLIYGVAFATQPQLADLNAPLNRSGGNLETRYNWQLNAHNHDDDYYFESIADSPAVPAADTDSFISGTISGGAKPLITVPMIGWIPKLGPSRGKLASYSIAKYGPQTSVDPYDTDAGNGISVTNNALITWNDPNDANSPTNVSFWKAYVQHLTNAWGASSNGGVGYYLMDNEHTIWHSTHRDVHPVGTTMQEILGDIITYAGMVKSVDSNALVLGPEEWGWSGYLYSGYDQQWAGANNNYNPANYPDRSSNGGWDYMPWLLNQLHQYQTTNGARLLDYFTLHCYPQEGSVSGNAIDYNTEILRNQSTRQFWDSNYVDPSWINSVIMLIPRMSNWVSTYYPGTKIGITEYNWGAEPNMSGATAQADILGIFGRQSLDLATRWTTPATNTPTYLAIKMYRNYDGNKSTFGDASVLASGPNPDNVSVFAATRTADAALTVMVVNKYLSGTTPVALTLSNFLSTGTAQVWQLNSSNAISRLSDVAVNAGNVNLSVPAQSVTLLVISAKPFNLQSPAARSNGNIGFSLVGEIGQTYIIQSSSNLVSWQSISTNTLTSTQTNFVFSANASRGFYRAMRVP
ncbi:MAG TPA: glycoside hydrolase family 44 protein [Verrucomicrobiae bacterium]|nr:glycoside hydrolase family 44 protein [Verrucomicrobiae bacterium]